MNSYNNYFNPLISTSSSGSFQQSNPPHEIFPNIRSKNLLALDYSINEYLPSTPNNNNNNNNNNNYVPSLQTNKNFRNTTPNLPAFYAMDKQALALHPSRNQPLTKQVNQLAYELPHNKYAKNSWSYAPEFIKVFSDVSVFEGAKVVFDCVLLGSPRPKVYWLFNDEKFYVDGVHEQIDDTSDLCRLTINRVETRHYGVYMVVAENEVGRAIATATLLPFSYNY